MKSKRILKQEAKQRISELQKLREWLLKHPMRVELELRRAAICWTEIEVTDIDREIKNAIRAGMTSQLRTRLKALVDAIIAQPVRTVKEEAR
ncbi:hypothetical protein [Paenibacillus herberti]|uniref:Uncharacterized protein n=1 Tax=Paenibacillus herberti TaxID=1619309 RepID=A0A229P5K9_9BACL|nr:hypothetical protein [Paenibacillus herberti]OXM17347.1 hypothetical protein CGZ75_12300 [Paenibacillus herberti]